MKGGKKKNRSSCFPFLQMPLQGRLAKPRENGLTMILDKGMSPAECAGMLALSHPYIDFIKLGFGTSALYHSELLAEKISLCQQYGVRIYPGGTFFEIACTQGKFHRYLRTVKNLGFTAIEISDGTIELPSALRHRFITKAAETGLYVISEVGKKKAEERLSVKAVISAIKADLKAGARKVILEGRESGKNIGLYNAEGEINETDLEAIVAEIDPDCIIWEAPLKKQQERLITRFGPNVNLGNIPPGEVMALEALRQGLRSDTFRYFLSR